MGQEARFRMASGGVPAAAVRAELARILGSQAFQRAPRLRRFLAYCVEEVLAERLERLKEYSLGLDVFDRGATFDPKADPIVRVDARRLRERIARYYAEEGAGNPVEIVLTTGGYVPVFRLRSGQVRPAGGAARLAVAPFEAAGGDAVAATFAEGLTDELMLALGRRPGLKVVAAPRAPGDVDDRIALAAELGVEVILGGKVRREAGVVRARAMLISAADGALMWADRYDARLDDVTQVFRLQDDLAGRIAELVAPQLAAERPAPRRARTPDAEAYELYLRGRHQLGVTQMQSLAAGAELLRQTVAHDPDFAEAHAALSEAHYLGYLFMLSPPREALAASRRCAEQALAIDPDLAIAHAYLARVSATLESDFAAAEVSFDRALAIDPTSPAARVARAVWLLSPLGRLEEAQAEFESLLEQDPYGLQLRMDYARILTYRRRFEEAIRHLELILAFQPDFPTASWALGFLYERVGRRDLAREAHAQHVRAIPYPLVSRWYEATLAGWEGDAARALSIVEAMDEEAQGAPGASGVMANAWIRLGEKDRAIAWMERAAEQRMFRIMHYAVDPDFESLHGEPRYERLLQRLGLRTAA
jgi:TolB-like protein/Tfp pilus assembly protein PilF